MEPTNPRPSPFKPHEGNAFDHDFDRLKDLTHCPPPSSAPVEETFYAFHAADPPDEADFLTAAQRSVYAGGDECVLRANSIFSDLGTIGRLCASMRKRGRGLVCRYISAGKIRRDSGVVSEGKDHHHSFWICGTKSMHAIFTERVQ
ncbi:MAG TPA: hypothetical protein VFC78_20325 [Tepidisphaeraceae bacterium]|nr:hypothetical protein [Tepidisphaeraceae bacterium]